MNWRTIDSAPLTGEPVILYAGKIKSYDLAGYVPFDSIDCVIGWWNNGAWESCFGDNHDSGCPTCGSWFEYPTIRPTHWMPLPETPNDA